MAIPTARENTHLISLICRINTAIRELESYLAQQREIARRNEAAGGEMASVSRPQSSGKTALM